MKDLLMMFCVHFYDVGLWQYLSIEDKIVAVKNYRGLYHNIKIYIDLFKKYHPEFMELPIFAKFTHISIDCKIFYNT